MTYCKAISCYKERLPTPPTPTIFESIFSSLNIISREKLWCSYHSECLRKLGEKTNIADDFDFTTEICEMETFETPFNGNCGYLIIKNSSASSSCPFYIWIACLWASNKKHEWKHGSN